MRIFHCDQYGELKVTKWIGVEDIGKDYYPVRIEYGHDGKIFQTLIKCPTEHRQSWVYRKLNKRRCLNAINGDRFKKR